MCINICQYVDIFGFSLPEFRIKSEHLLLLENGLTYITRPGEVYAYRSLANISESLFFVTISIL
jgi:hypothetical protein